MLSTTCKYGIRASIYLAIYGKEKLINIKQMAKGLEIPEPFLGKIMQTLAKRKVLYSQRGIDGGFKFNKDPIGTNNKTTGVRDQFNIIKCRRIPGRDF